MPDPPEGPVRRPSVGGVDIPPLRQRQPSRPGTTIERTAQIPSEMPREQKDWLEKLLTDLKEGNEAIQKELAVERGRDLAWRSEIEERVARLERGFIAYERLTVQVERVTYEITHLSEQQGTLVKTVLQNAQTDIVTARDLGDLKADLATMAAKTAREVSNDAGGRAGDAAGTIAGHEAGKRAGRFWAAMAGLFTLLALFWDHCGPTLTKAINATPDAPKIEQRK